jgi:inosine/xanthosine triphosphate pyrophosphatase family protein
VASLQKSAAQLSSAEKNAISHRGQALQALLQKLQEKLG